MNYDYHKNVLFINDFKVSKPYFMKKPILNNSKINNNFYNDYKKVGDGLFDIPLNVYNKYSEKLATSNDYFVYIKIEIFSQNNEDVILTIFNDKQICMIWFNKVFQGYCNEWYSRKIIKLKKGKNSLIIEVHKYIFRQGLTLSISPLYNGILEDEFHDIKKHYLRINQKKNKNQIGIIYCSDSSLEKSNKKVFIVSPEINMINRAVTYNIIDKLVLKKNHEFILNLNNYANEYAGWVFLYLCNFNAKENSINFENDVRYRVFIKEPKEAYDNLFFEIKKRGENNYTKNELKSLFNINDLYVNRTDIGYDIKYYFLYNQLRKIFDNKNTNTLQKNCILGVQKISFISKYNNLKTTFSISVPPNISTKRQIKLLMILSINSCSAYIDYYYKKFGKDFMIVECDLKGNNFGNYIGEYTVFEVINKVKKIYSDLSIEEIYLFGYSSCASAVINLCGRFPNFFNGGLAIAGISNEYIINNCTNLIFICGYQDINIKSFCKLEKDTNTKNVHFYFLDGYNHSSISTFMRNEMLINKLLSNKALKNDILYIGISEAYNPYSFFKVIERQNSNEIFKYKITFDNDKMNVKTRNIKTLYIEKTKDVDQININNVPLLMNNNKSAFFKIGKENIIEKIIKIKRAINNGLGILNIYRYQTKIWIKDKNEKKLLKSFACPKDITYNANTNINFPILFLNENDKNYKFSRQNNIFYNQKIRNDEDSLILIPKEEGFEYNKKIYHGNYSIIQCLPNYYNKTKYYNLYINDNGLKNSMKNFFIRNVFLPSEFELSNSIYNNFCILYYESKYYSIRFYGDRLNLIK